MKKHIVILSLLILPISNSHAIDIGSVTEILNSNETILAKEIKNTVDSARLVSLKIEKIDNPMNPSAGTPINSNELLATPANVILPANGSDVFKIIYNGPNDDIERYYRLMWSDSPITEKSGSSSNKTATATTSAIIGSILVVTPRIDNLSYNINKNTDKVTNNGNSSFRVVASGNCIKKPEETCREQYYLMPGYSVEFQSVKLNNKKSHVGIWYNDNFISAN